MLNNGDNVTSILFYKKTLSVSDSNIKLLKEAMCCYLQHEGSTTVA